MTAPQEWRIERDAGVWTFTIDRPARRNAFTWDMRFALLQALVDAERSGDCGAFVITGTGDKAFCSGGDVGTFRTEVAHFDEQWPNSAMANMRAVGEIVRRMLTTPVVVITAVNGAAFGGGCFMALAADIVVAHRRAKFGFGFSKTALVADWAGHFVLPRLVGMAQAKNLILRGQTLEAARAHEMGMIAELVDEEPMPVAMRIAREIAAGPRVATGMAKQLLGKAFETGLDGMLTYEMLAQTVARRTGDHREGIEAFLDKRPPRFQGK